MGKKYIVAYAEYDNNMMKDALCAGVLDIDFKARVFDSVHDAHDAVIKHIKSYIEREDYDSDEEWEKALKGCIWRGYDGGDMVCEEHCGIETAYRIIELL